jgi:hypothetical protein
MHSIRTEVLGRKIIAFLSQRARAVIGLSQIYSEQLQVIHMEHLFFALVDLHTTITLEVLKVAGVDRSRLLSELAQFNVPGKPLKATDLNPPVHMSTHVGNAIDFADSIRRSRDREQLRTRDLLLGFLTVSDCEVVQRLAELGINRQRAQRVIAEDEQNRESSSVSVADELGQGQPESPQTPTSADINQIRKTLLNGTDDERQVVTENIAANAGTVDYHGLREQLVLDLTGDSYRGEAWWEPRSWMISALGYVSSPNNSDVVTLLSNYLDPSREPSEAVRFWTLAAIERVTGEVPEELISTSDRSGAVGKIAEAFQVKKRGQTPAGITRALQSGDDRQIWTALLALRVVAFPSLIPIVCNLLHSARTNPSSTLPYNAIMALAHPEIIAEAARALESQFGTQVTVELIVQVARNSKRLREFSRLLALLDPRGVRTSLDELIRSSDLKSSVPARALMDLLSVTVVTDEIAPVAGYASDSIPNQRQKLTDELGINKDVQTLCSVLLAREVSPPLAVGLFGDWGTGKSYFMEKMYREIEILADRAGRAEKTAFHSKVVQIRFNAWHYADSSLWASLVSHIFDELSRKVCPTEDPEETKRKLLLQLESAKQVRIDAEIEQKRAEEERTSAEKSLEEARNKREKKQVDLAQLRMPDLLEILSEKEQQELRKELAGLFEDLGLPPALNSVKELNEVYHQAFTLMGRTQAALASLWRSKDRTTLIVLLAAAFVLVPSFGYLIQRITHVPGLAGVTAVVANIAVAIGGFSMEFKKHLSWQPAI